MEEYNKIEETVNFDNFSGKVLVSLSKGTIKGDDNELSDEYDLIFWAYFVPDLFNTKLITIHGRCGFDTNYEEDRFELLYYPEDDIVLYTNEYYRKSIVGNKTFDKYKNNVFYRNEMDVSADTLKDVKDKNFLPYIRFPRTKAGVSIPLLIERIFRRIPSKIIFYKNW